MLPNDFFLAYSTLVGLDDSDPEAEMDYTIDEDDEEDDDNSDMEPIASELPGLLLDAELEIIDMTYREMEEGDENDHQAGEEGS